MDTEFLMKFVVIELVAGGTLYFSYFLLFKYLNRNIICKKIPCEPESGCPYCIRGFTRKVEDLRNEGPKPWHFNGEEYLRCGPEKKVEPIKFAPRNPNAHSSSTSLESSHNYADDDMFGFGDMF
ncbi:MAG: hypothetical protein Q7R94_02245 [bacterium]|nr:hypothetical protein [bacterium]